MDDDLSDLTREQLIANILRYKIELVRQLAKGDFSIHPSNVLDSLNNCLTTKTKL